jgi:hypothetical protein
MPGVPKPEPKGDEPEKRGRGRPPGFRMSDEHRVKIRNSNILNALIAYAEGERKMSVTQASVGLRLLKKVLPDLPPLRASGPDTGGSARTRLTPRQSFPTPKKAR